MKQDRFLLVILAGIAVLAVAAIALFFIRQQDQSYVPDDTPQGVVRNYILALQNEDFERAYAYLSEVENKPSLEAFQATFLTERADANSAVVQIGEARQSGATTIVEVTLVYASRGPFFESSRQPMNATLEQDPAGAWKITSMPYPFWDFSWENPPAKP